MLDNALRLQYLQALGIDVWIPKADSVQPPCAMASGLVQALQPPTPAIPVALAAETEATGWDALETAVAGCTRCGLCNTRKHTVFGTGNRQADWLFIGEGPGQHEDEQGKPFVGNAGQLLTEMIRAIGLSRDAVFITNVVKCRPPGNRDPHSDEIASCHPYLQQQINLIQPKIIVALGRIAAQKLLKTDAPLAQLRGKPHYFSGVPLVVVYHPAYLLRTPIDKRKAWQDLQFAVQLHNSQPT